MKPRDDYLTEEDKVRMAANLKSMLPWKTFDLENKIAYIVMYYEENYND